MLINWALKTCRRHIGLGARLGSNHAQMCVSKSDGNGSLLSFK